MYIHIYSYKLKKICIKLYGEIVDYVDPTR